MADKNEVNVVKKSKRGTRYETNPFVVDAAMHSSSRTKKIINSDGSQMMIVSNGTGEVLGQAGFWRGQKVESTQFVKLYINGVKGIKELSAAGTKAFEILYLKVQENIGKDTLWLTFPSIDQNITPIGETTFYRGMKELLEKNFIAESVVPGRYFLNMDFMWNGDRLSFVNEFWRENDSRTYPEVDTKTLDIFNQAALNAPDSKR